MFSSALFLPYNQSQIPSTVLCITQIQIHLFRRSLLLVLVLLGLLLLFNLLLLLCFGFLHLNDLLDDLLFFDQERTEDSVSDARVATRTTIGTADRLLRLGQSSILAGAQGRDTGQGVVAVSALGGRRGLLGVLNNKTVSGSLDNSSGVAAGVVAQSTSQLNARHFSISHEVI